MLAKVHVAEGRKVVAVCDSLLLGKRFEEAGFQIDLTGSFFMGEEVTESRLVKLLDNAFSATFVGEESVGFAVRHGIVEASRISRVGGIPQANFMSLL